MTRVSEPRPRSVSGRARIGGGVGLAAGCRVPHLRARPHPKPAGRSRRRRPRERGRTPRRTPPIFTRAALPAPAGTGPRGRRGQRPRRKASESGSRRTSEFHPEPSRGRRRRDGGARNGQPPAKAAPSRVSGGAVAEERGRPSPSRVSGEGQRGVEVARSGAREGKIMDFYFCERAWHTRGQSEFGLLPLSGSTPLCGRFPDRFARPCRNQGRIWPSPRTTYL